MTKKRILQVMPADGWLAVFETPGGGIFTQRLVCWALKVDDDGYQSVEGMCGYECIGDAANINNFDGYVHESELGQLTDQGQGESHEQQ